MRLLRKIVGRPFQGRLGATQEDRRAPLSGAPRAGTLERVPYGGRSRRGSRPSPEAGKDVGTQSAIELRQAAVARLLTGHAGARDAGGRAVVIEILVGIDSERMQELVHDRARRKVVPI